MQTSPHLERLRQIAVEVFQQRGISSGPAPALEKDGIAVCGGTHLILLKLVDNTASPPVEIMAIRGTDSPLKCLVVDSSDSDLVQARMLAMLDRLLEKDQDERR